MDNKLIDIERQGNETNVIMQSANKDLRNQRDIIVSVSDKNKNINDNLKQGEKVISSLSQAEFKNRLFLYLTILILFCTDIFMVVFVITKKFSNK